MTTKPLVDTLKSALSQLCSQEETVRRCAEICSDERDGVSDYDNGYNAALRDCKAAILAAFGIKEK